MTSPLLSIFRQILKIHQKKGSSYLKEMYKDMESFLSKEEIEIARSECVDYNELEVFNIAIGFVEKYRNHDVEDENCYLEILEIGSKYLEYYKKMGIKSFAD